MAPGFQLGQGDGEDGEVNSKKWYPTCVQDVEFENRPKQIKKGSTFFFTFILIIISQS